MKVKNNLFVYIIICFSISCVENKHEDKFTNEARGKGFIKIAVEESYQPLMTEAIKTFNGLFPEATIEATYTTENECVNLLLKDSVRLVIMSRKLTEAEKKVIENQKNSARENEIAIDAIAVINHKNNACNKLTMNQLIDIAKGKISRWSQLNKSNTQNDSIIIVLDNKASGIAHYLIDSLLKNNKLPANLFATKSNKEVIEYVKNNDNALGFIGLNWISDNEDTVANKFVQSIQVVGIARKNNENYTLPFQYHLLRKEYPMMRTVYLVDREGFNGLATKFLNFLVSQNGQFLILKQELLPSTLPKREVELINEPIF